jgi:hypothetical protein
VLAFGFAQAADTIAIDADDIAGVVSSAKGPEAGVWVIAETKDLPTKFARIVVTDDRGRYLIPDLPKANYDVWVRGYGLVDSSHVKGVPGTHLNLTATIAPDARAAAQYYPSGYWFSLIQVPAKSEFPGTGANGIAPAMKTQEDWLRNMKSGTCWACHALGTKETREIPAALGGMSSGDAWQRRILSGQAGPDMMRGMSAFGMARALTMFSDWTDRIAKGEVPPQPPRPQGLERAVVITEWDWADPKAYMHDEVSTDRRNPRLNANGLIYGSTELSTDYLQVLDPVHNTISRVPLAPSDSETSMTSQDMPAPSMNFGAEPPWDSHVNVHNPMFDEQGRVWITSTVRPGPNPDYCKQGSDLPSAKLFPLNTSSRQLAVYDPKTKTLTHISTCYSTHHLMFAEDANRTLWTSGGGAVVGGLNTKMCDETHEEAKSRGWSALSRPGHRQRKRDDYRAEPAG